MKHKLLLFSLLLSFIVGCTMQEELSSVDGALQARSTTISNGVKPQNAESLSITADDIKCAMNNLDLFKHDSAERNVQRAKAADAYTIDSVKINGTVRFYVVNYAQNGGYVLLSATRAVYPVLAYADEGNFDVNGLKPDGLLSWMSAVDNYSEARESLPTDSLFDSMSQWRDLLQEIPELLINGPQKSTQKEDIYTKGKRLIREAVSEAIDNYEAEAIYYANEKFCDDDAICFSVWDIAKDMVYVDYQEDWENYLFIAKRQVSQYSNRVDKLIKTQWGQGNGFNRFYTPNADGTLPKAGCAPVAAAQLMYYFKTPSFYNWEAMSLTSSDDYNAKLIHDLSVKMHTSQTGGTAEDDIPLGFKDYYYITHVGKDLNSNLLNNLKTTGPLYLILSGIHVSQIKGRHACLAIGGTHIKRDWGFDLFYIKNPNDEEASIKRMHAETIVDAPHFYINWGWEGDYDGYYHNLEAKNYSFWIDDIFYVKPSIYVEL